MLFFKWTTTIYTNPIIWYNFSHLTSTVYLGGCIVAIRRSLLRFSRISSVILVFLWVKRVKICFGVCVWGGALLVPNFLIFVELCQLEILLYHLSLAPLPLLLGTLTFGKTSLTRRWSILRVLCSFLLV